MIVGLTGGIGSGKTTVAKLFSEFENVAIYIADDEAKKLMNSSKIIKKQLISELGENSYNNEGLNRKYIADKVFNNAEKLAKLNAIVHPEVRKHFQDFVSRNKDKAYIIYEAAILFESKSNQFCAKIITVIADEKTRINRIIARDKTTEKEVRNRMQNQWNDTKKILQSNYIIKNEDLSTTKQQVVKIHNFLTKKKASV